MGLSDGLKAYLKNKGIDAEFHSFDESTVAASDSARLMKVPIQSIVKTVVFTDGSAPVLAIVQGNQRVSEKKLSDACGKDLRIAKAKEVKSLTGYKVGEVPPIGHSPDVSVFLDSPIEKMEDVVAGGGDTHTLLKMKTKDVISLVNAQVAEISE